MQYGSDDMPNMPDECNQLCFCPVKGIIDVISKKWTLFIINALGNRGKLRFNDLMKELSGISPKTLSDTLKGLTEEGLIQRESFAEIPPRVEYSLTQEGVELRKAIIPLLKWTATRKHAPNYKCSYRKLPAHLVKTDKTNQTKSET